MKKLEIKKCNVQEIEEAELKEIEGGSLFEDFGIFMGVLFYENTKLNEKMNYSGMVASFGH